MIIDRIWLELWLTGDAIAAGILMLSRIGSFDDMHFERIILAKNQSAKYTVQRNYNQ